MSRARDIANYGDGIDTSSITSGTFADARIAQSNVTQHESAIDALGTVASGTFNGTIGLSATHTVGWQHIQTFHHTSSSSDTNEIYFNNVFSNNVKLNVITRTIVIHSTIESTNKMTSCGAIS